MINSPINFINNSLSFKQYKEYKHPIIFTDEIWKEIDDSIIKDIKPGYYISTYGRLYSSFYGYYMKPAIDKYGYLKINLQKNDGTRKYTTIHRLVALAFIVNNNPKTKKLVNHKDDIRTNSHVDNLEWCDYRYNNIYSYRRNNNTNKFKSLTNEQVHSICQMLENGVSVSNIVSVLYPDKLNDANFVENAKQCIRRILRKDGYSDISVNYDFSKYKRENRSMDKDTIKWVCEMIELGYRNIDINRILYSDYDNFHKKVKNKLNARISSIRIRKNYSSISNNYNW